MIKGRGERGHQIKGGGGAAHIEFIKEVTGKRIRVRLGKMAREYFLFERQKEKRCFAVKKRETAVKGDPSEGKKCDERNSRRGQVEGEGSQQSRIGRGFLIRGEK